MRTIDRPSAWVLLAFAAFLAGASGITHAACSSFQPPPELYVGDKASDSACTQDNIQDAIDAATCPYGTNIYVTREHTYTLQHLNIDNRHVTLIARGDQESCGTTPIICTGTCVSPPPIVTPLVALRGNDNQLHHAGTPVITITGNSDVTLRYFDISGGLTTSNGGAISFDGAGSLTLDTAWLRGNTGLNGGGIHFNGAGAARSTLTLLSYTLLSGNTATDSGGAIHVSGKGQLNAVSAHTSITGNKAANYGGAIDVSDEAIANIGAPDDNGIAVIEGNHANYGGGIAVVAENNDDKMAIVNVFATDAFVPTSITHNTARQTGGGVYLRPKATTFTAGAGNRVAFCGSGFRIANNTAQEGGAMYLDLDSGAFDTLGSETYLGADNCSYTPVSQIKALGAIDCKSASCSTIDNNTASDDQANLTSAILIQDASFFIADRFSMRENVADHVLRVAADYSVTKLSNCLMVRNLSGHELIYTAGDNSTLSITGCTLADNVIDSVYVIHTGTDLTLTSDIIDAPSTRTIDSSVDASRLAINYNLFNDSSTIPDSATHMIYGSPTFVDLDGGDYHLAANSLGIDFSPNHGTLDLSGAARSVDLASVPNGDGFQDLGAYERQNLFLDCGAADSLFCDGFGP
jgi:predicted outer membrane repeat protein